MTEKLFQRASEQIHFSPVSIFSAESVRTAGNAKGEPMTSGKSQMDSAPTKKAKHCGSENPHTDAIEQLREQHRKEIAALKHSASKALADALNDQQRQILQRQFFLSIDPAASLG